MTRKKRIAIQNVSEPGSLSRAMFIRYGALGAAAAVAAPALLSGTASSAFAADVPQPKDPQAPGAILPSNRSGGIPAGPASYGFLAADITSWTPSKDPQAKHFVCHIPRATRIAPFAATQAHPTLDPATQLLAIDGDYRGSIYDERARAIGDEPYVYSFRYWQYLDIFSSWHGQLTPQVPNATVVDRTASGRSYGVLEIPNAGWTEAAHKNGAMSISCWFWPRDGAVFADFVKKNSDGSYPVADKMIEIRKYFGFDGYFLNQEASVSSANAAAFKAMMQYLKAKDPQCYLQYYDAMLENGSLSYQNMINSSNVGWLGTPQKPLMDSIFMNYGWLRGWGTTGTAGPDPTLSKSAKTVTDRGFDAKKVAFGTTEFQQGIFNPSEIFGDLAAPGKKPPVSWGMFVPSEFWNKGCDDGTTRTVYGRSLYRGLEQKFWSGPKGDPSLSGRISQPTSPYRKNVWNTDGFDGVAHSIVEKSPYSALPIYTNFTIGVGSYFNLNGVSASTAGWNNAGIADPVLSWQYWTENTGSTKSTVALDETVAWEGSHSLKVQSTAGAAPEFIVHLFKTDLMVTAQSTASIKVKSSGTLPTISVVLTPKATPGSPLTIPLAASGSAVNGWSTLSAALGTISGAIARISVKFSGTSAINLNLGQFRLAAGSATPTTPSGLTVSSASAISGGASAFLDWTKAADGYAYDIFAVNGSKRSWLGRCHRDCFFVAKTALPSDRKLNFELVAIAKDGGRSTAATASYQL
ncbi:hypothetical protein [Psychromicrobium sp. YIM B11713]|uniref:endo-beta-N-acetylglucosaminidase n=1 Tax=Psychromicrobium sp. YIM B11713 TaxID=3145233 RepID=UPI00374E2DEE